MADLKELIKNSLNMGKTGLEMKANLTQKEPKIQKEWEDNDIYQLMIDRNHIENKQWILHDGPPYANGDLHVGHALNKILKDIIVRYKNAKGFYAPFVIGWDTHGLPIEHALTKKLGKEYNNLSTSEKRQKCYEFALANVAKQKEQFKKFGLFTNWNKYYITMSADFEARQLQLFLKMIEKKLVFQALKPVYWSWSSQTALAEAEIEYKDLEANSIYIGFDVVDGKGVLQPDDKIIIWTTTPWTIPSNLAVAVNPDFDYVRVCVGATYYVVSKDLLNNVATTLGWNEFRIVSQFKGKDLELITYKHPLYPSKINPIILAAYVSGEDGTGLVHNAPGFGADDYIACKAYKIEPFCPIDKLGKFDASVNDDQLAGVFYEDANDNIINRLNESHNLLKATKIVHSAAIDWRTKKPVIYRATKQWFVNIETIKDEIINCLDAVKFNSSSNKNHMIEMIRNRTEWCISRQRVWGVPICIIYDEKEEPILDYDLNKNIVDILSKEGTNVWFEKPVEYFLTDKYSHAKGYSKCLDTMDVWFDSGSTHMMFEPLGWNKQADLYLEGNDQYRGWFNSSAITSTIVKDASPYKQLISHGMVVDEQGRKMSKSLGNGVDPLKVCNVYGADILRMWVANSNYVTDVSISDNILKQIAEMYRRIRNSLFRFCLSNIDDFDLSKANYNFDESDLYVLNQLQDNIAKINKAYEEFDFSVCVKLINAHIIELSGWYFDLIKDSLYCDEVDNDRRRTIQTVLYHLFTTYLIFLAPIIPHTASEVYSFFKSPNKQFSVMAEKWVDKLPFEVKPIDKEKWNQIFKIKDMVFTQIEKLRNDKVIAKNNEAEVYIEMNNKFNITPELLKNIFNVAIVRIVQQDIEDIKIDITKTGYVKCQRCWNYFPADQVHEDLCPRCAKILKRN